MSNKSIFYPVILKQEEKDVFVTIPDIEGGFTQGSDYQDAINMAQDAMGNLLEDLKDSDYPSPSEPDSIKLESDERLVYVPIDMNEFRKKHPKTVRTNVTIPADLKAKAKAKDINISKLLTEAIRSVVEQTK